MFSLVLPLKNVVKVLIKVDTHVAFLQKWGRKYFLLQKRLISSHSTVRSPSTPISSFPTIHATKWKKWTHYQQPMFPKNNVFKHVNKGTWLFSFWRDFITTPIPNDSTSEISKDPKNLVTFFCRYRGTIPPPSLRRLTFAVCQLGELVRILINAS